MSAETIAEVYAEALFALASERGERAEIDQELRDVAEVLRDHRDIYNFFTSPGTPKDEKLNVVDQALAPHLDRLTANFLRLLVHKGREMFFERIREAYQALVDAAEGRLEIKVTSAAPLGDEVAARIADELGRMTDQKVELETSVDASLIGGITIRVGDRLLDASLSTRLRRLREQALGG